MKIKTKIFLIATTSTLLLIIVVISVFQYFYTGFLKKEISEHLQNVTYAKSLHISTILETQKKNVLLLTKGAVLFSKILQTSSEHEDYEDTFNKVQNRLRQIVEGDFYEVSLLSNDGVIVASSNKERLGDDRSKHPYFSKPKDRMFVSKVYFCDASQQYAIAIFAPIFNIADEKKIDGTLVVKIGTRDLNSVVSNEFREDREFYLINSEKLMITQSRFIKDNILNQKIDSKNAENCFAFKNSYSLGNNPNKKVTTSFLNYRGESVIGHYTYLPEMNWCLLAEINEKEALAPLRKTWQISIGLFFIVTVIILIASRIIGNKVSRPIEKLIRGAMAVQKGNLDSKISIQSNDEIGTLAKSFEDMTRSLKKYRDETEEKVVERTKDLEKLNKHMVGRELKMMELKKEIKKLENIKKRGK